MILPLKNEICDWSQIGRLDPWKIANWALSCKVDLQIFRRAVVLRLQLPFLLKNQHKVEIHGCDINICESNLVMASRGGWSTQAHREKTRGATAVLRHFLEYLSIICVKRNIKCSSTFIWKNFFVKVLLICENVCKRSLFLINFSVEIRKTYN